MLVVLFGEYKIIINIYWNRLDYYILGCSSYHAPVSGDLMHRSSCNTWYKTHTDLPTVAILELDILTRADGQCSVRRDQRMRIA